MSSFKLPPISPLAGARLTTFFRVLKGNRVAPRYYLKIGITSVLALLVSALQWVDWLHGARKRNRYSFKESPLFIIGHWRSGTTLLHNILTKDPVAGYVTTYHSVFPNSLNIKWLFKTFMRIFMPSERPGDGMKMSVDLPQEDEYALSNISHRSFYHFFYFPSTYRNLYKGFIRFEAMDEDEQVQWKLNYHKMVIKALLNTHGKRAVLKNPVNTARMRPLNSIFPEANFIFMIRNPLIVYLSTKKFFGELFPTVNLEAFSEEELSDLILEVYSRLIRDYLEDKKWLNSKRILELRYESMQLDPLKEVEKIYKHFNFSDFEELKPDFQAYLESINGHATDSYSMDQKELDRVLEKLEFAMQHWNYGIPEDLIILNKKNIYKEKNLAV